MAVVATGEMVVNPDMKGFESKLGNIAKKAGLAFGGAFAAQKGFQFLGDAVAEARESNKVAAQTAAVLKSTGGAAGVTAKQIDTLANSISRKTGIDDEQIAKASNLLLTFTNIKNAAGENNDVFNQATKIAADMGAALGTDAAGSAIQLGKALNDPIKGISALSRVGVTFNDEQKKTIENFVKTGNVAGAQKVILAELAKEFGGSAAAQATASDRLKVTLGNLKEDLGNKLIPILDRAATFLANNLPSALNAAGQAFGAIQRVVGPVVEKFGMFFNALRTGFTEDEGTGIENFALRVRDVLGTLLDAFKSVFGFVMDNKEVLVGFGAAVLAGLVPAFIAWATAAGAAAVATIAAAAPAIAAAAAVGVLTAAVVYAYNHWSVFRAVVQTAVGTAIKVLGGLKDIGVGTFNAIKGAVEGFINIIKRAWEWVKKLLDAIGRIKIPGGGVVGKIGNFLGFAEGGVVPGPIGAPRLAVVHGGEEVLTPQQRTAGGMFRDLIIQGATFEGADRTATAVVRELRAEAYRQGR